ncbi:MAG: hypothetical protein KJ630_00370 [Proteobacteria bacterium]|nr:hypothetical protein [Pseudomonadota bacterium]
MKTIITRKDESESCRTIVKTTALGVGIWLLMLAALISPAFAADDDLPFFAGGNGAPNIMFVFDNSDSMQDIPYSRADGRQVRPGTNPNSANNTSYYNWPWRRGVKLNDDNTVFEVSGNVQYDEAAFPSDTEMAIPEQTPLNLPGTSPASLTSTVDTKDDIVEQVIPGQTPANLPGTAPASLSSTMTSIPTADRIYDTSLDWTTATLPLRNSTDFDLNYRYRLVEVRSADPAEDPQYATIISRSYSSNYFQLDANLVYNGAKIPYTYTILAEGPGRVTQTASSDARYVRDANINWSDVAANWSTWNGRLLIVTSGTNAGETRTINSYSESSKYWRVSVAFPVPCDNTSRYVIKETPSDPTRIYDASLDWTTPATALTDSTLFNLNYLYRIVEVTSATGTVQQRTITGRSTSGKYFTFDTAAEAGGNLTYDAAERPYTYKILTDGPGQVTRVYSSNLRRVTDADFDWSTLPSWSDFSAKWRNRTLVITTGPNKDLSRTITGYSTSSKYWEVDTAFPVACDLNTRFKILGTADDERYAFGGNHPASKLYQAKKAVNLFLTDPSLKVCTSTDPFGACLTDRYAVNMGFATYLSARVPRVTAKYYRIRSGAPAVPASGGDVITVPGYWTDPPAVPARACAYYKNISSTSGTFYSPNSDSEFIASGWKTAASGSTSWSDNRLHTGVSVGYRFDRLYYEGNCREQTIRYSVTSIDPDPTDSLPNQYKITVQSRTSVPATEGGYWSESYQCANVASCAALPATIGGRPRIPTSGSCYPCNFTAAYDDPPYWTPDYTYTTPIVPATPAAPDWYQTTYREVYGRYNIVDPNTPQYVDPATNLVKPYNGYSGSGSTPKLVPNPNLPSSDYTLLTVTIPGVSLDYYGTTSGDVEPNTFDTSYFMYPGLGTADRPHGWSYKKTSSPWIYGQSDQWTNSNYGNFPKAVTNWNYMVPYPWPGAPTIPLPNGSWDASTWEDSIQPSPYFPAVTGDEMANFTGNDQTVFVNLPVYNGASATFGDDTAGVSISKILEYTDLARVNSPDNKDSWTQYHDYTIMPYSKSIAPNAYSALQGSGTPIAASLQDLKKYYDSYIQQDSATQGGCRKNYVIFLTDGLETGGGDPVQAAQDLLELQVNGSAYPIYTYVIGFGLDAASQATLNAIAAAGGTGQAYFANNVETLVDILVNEITSSIIGNSYSRSAPVITSYVAGEDLHLFTTRFDYPKWRGHLYGYNVDPGTVEITGPITGWLSDCDDADALPDGDAGCEMKVYGRADGDKNRIFSSYYDSGDLTRVVFDPTNATSVTTLKKLVNPLNLDINGIGGVNALPAVGPFNDADAATVMSYVLNSGYDGGKYRGGRDANWPLGDIYHSGTVVVGPPRFTPPAAPAIGVDPYEGYVDFKAAVAMRETRIYVGANDGMVHAIKASNGREDWAYIPNSVLGKLYEFREGHRFTVDLPIRAADIYSPGGAGTIWTAVVLGSEDDGWHTMITSGLRDGGYSLWALDVTDPTDPQPAWETTDGDANPATRDMGKTWSTPNFGRVFIDGVSTHVVIAGGGLSADENRGNNLYILDAGSGAILKEIAIGNNTNHVPSEILLVTDNDKSSPYLGHTKTAYFGDTSGDLWKLTGLNDAKDGAAWDPQAVLLFDGVGKVFHKPAIANSKGVCKVTVGAIEYNINVDTTFILYGTGDEENPTDLASTDRVYEIADPPLTPVVITDPTLTKVWEVPFFGSEKLLSDPTTYLNTFYFVTYSPEGGCAQGESFYWGLTATKCGQAGNTGGIMYDLTGSSVGGPHRRLSLGAGITSSIVAAGPKLLISVAGGAGDPNSGSNDEDDLQSIAAPTVNRLEYWRENLQ